MTKRTLRERDRVSLGVYGWCKRCDQCLARGRDKLRRPRPGRQRCRARGRRDHAGADEVFSAPQHSYTWSLLGSVSRCDQQRTERLARILDDEIRPKL